MMKRTAAKYLYTLVTPEPVMNGFVELEDDGTVIRTGADIKMKCSGCGRIVMLDRETFLKRRKKLLVQGPEPAPLDMSRYAP